ncbi:MAG: peptidyl-prolyl cis-trans isomerase [SAR86 cluster bacterium]|nr:peptidyl-prolyl cis-trans isomerase [SAR86 cluster bacterium]
MKKKSVNSFLLIIMFLSIFFVAYSLIKETNFTNDNWVAKVNDIPISKAKYLLQMEGLSKDKSNSLTKDDKLYVLERMIEEELLIRRAVDLGLLSNNTVIRGTIIQQIINSIISDNALIPIKENELKEFFDENKDFFRSSDKLRVRQLYFRGNTNESLIKADKAFFELQRGKSFEEVSLNADQATLQIPDVLMTLAKVREYIGPSLMKLAKSLKPGEFTSPKKVSNGYRIIYLVDKQDSPFPTFEVSRDQIKAEFMKRRDDNSLRSYIDNLKKWYDIKRKGVEG